MTDDALLILENGQAFYGTSIGVPGQTVGEVVFNTAMTGYQEMLTDPSYDQQIITLTAPHIGNIGTHSDDAESDQVWAAGLVVRDLSPNVSHWRDTQSLSEYCHAHQLIAIADIDTRQLTRVLREHGSLRGCILAGQLLDEAKALAATKAFPGLAGLDLAKAVSTKTPYQFTEASWDLKAGHVQRESAELPYHVVVYDFGVKRNILRLLVDQGCRLTVVPAQTDVQTVLALEPDGIVLSNGPGDPAACDYAIKAIAALCQTDIPMLGICLGMQLLALALGARTKKMKFGHHGANHPIQALDSGRVMITSQNHGFCVDEQNLPDCICVTHRSLFDQTLQGFRHRDKAIFAWQGHPEGSPGPHDASEAFAEFVHSIKHCAPSKA